MVYLDKFHNGAISAFEEQIKLLNSKELIAVGAGTEQQLGQLRLVESPDPVTSGLIELYEAMLKILDRETASRN